MFRCAEHHRGAISSFQHISIHPHLPYNLQPIAMGRKRTAPVEPIQGKRPRSEVQQTLYIRNLNDKINRRLLKHNLYMLFSTYGDVFDINMKMKGQAHIVLDCPRSASVAMRALQHTNVFGKEISIDYSKTKTKAIEAAEIALAEE